MFYIFLYFVAKILEVFEIKGEFLSVTWIRSINIKYAERQISYVKVLLI